MLLPCFPTRIACTACAAITVLQGEGGLYYTGEYLNGLGVPVQAYGASTLVKYHF